MIDCWHSAEPYARGDGASLTDLETKGTDMAKEKKLAKKTVKKKEISREKTFNRTGLTKKRTIKSGGKIVLLGLTGSLGSGCTFIAKGIKKTLKKNCYRFQLSATLHENLKESGVQKPSIKQLQDEGNRLRLKHGISALAIDCVNRIRETEKNNTFDSDTVVLIDGIRNDGEIRALRSFPNFYLMSVHAKKDIREKRLVGPGKKFSSKDDFDTADKRDEKEDIQNGQQVKRCNDLSDIIIRNNDPLQENTDNKKLFFEKLVTDYIDTIKSVRDASPRPDHPPKINELLMTMAYCASKRSSCEKRKVGAVIAHMKEFHHLIEEIKRPEDNKKFLIVSSGYNEVPLGTDPCTLGKHQKCYRDHMREELARKYLHCPKCGEPIPDEIECPSCKAVYARKSIECYCSQKRSDQSECKTDLLANYECNKCKTEVFNAYLPGSVKGSGKLLDICRALHAEESAIIGLAGVGKPNNGKLVLYTTTYPCNLCANKIVAAGIELVIYAEPYTIEEAENILRGGRVLTERFEGVKSSAYFRLYS